MVDSADGLVPGLVEPVSAAMRVLVPRIPVPPAAALGRVAAPADSGLRGVDERVREALSRVVPAGARTGTARVMPLPGRVAAAPARHGDRQESPVLGALRVLGSLPAERLLGALELTVPTLDFAAVPDVTPYVEPLRPGPFSLAYSSADSAAVMAATMLHQFRADMVELIGELTGKLAAQPAITRQLTVSDDVHGEIAIAAAHGAAYLALGVATAAAVLHNEQFPQTVDRTAAAIGVGVGSAMLALRAAPVPAGYAAAVLDRVRQEYLLPRRAGGSVSVDDHWFALVEGEPPADVDFHANGVVTAVPGGAVIRAGRAEGSVRVLLAVLAEEPAEVDGTGWDEIVDISWHAAQGHASVVGPRAPGDRNLRRATAPWPGDYRLRVHASGRDDPADDEHYELVVWPAPPAPQIVHKATDRLGHRLRGEPEPPLPEAPERQFRWVRNSALADAATVTVVTGMTMAGVVRAFGGDPDHPESLREQAADMWTMTSDQCVAVLADGGAVFVVELNGYVGAQETPLVRASAGGRAASMFWNVNALTRLSFAEGGRMLASFEPPEEGMADEPAVAEALAGIDFEDYRHTYAKGLAAVARFTGHGLTEERLDRIMNSDVAYRITDV
jgi:hypothetical protein